MVESFDPSAPLLPDPPALEAPSAAAEVCSGASGFGSLDFSAVFTFGKMAAGVSINPITGDSGMINQFLLNHSTPSCESLELDLSHVPEDVGS